MIKSFASVLFLVVGAILSIYVGFWVCLVGGVADILSFIKIADASNMLILSGILKILSASFVGWFIFVFFLMIAKSIKK